LPHVTGALDALCRSSATNNGRKQKSGQNSDYGDERQKFDQGERGRFVSVLQIHTKPIPDFAFSFNGQQLNFCA
jgi:hypothetical protein